MIYLDKYILDIILYLSGYNKNDRLCIYQDNTQHLLCNNILLLERVDEVYTYQVISNPSKI